MLLDVLAGLNALEDTRTQAGQPFVHGELVPAMVRVDPLGTARLIPLAPRHWAEPGTLPAPERCGHLSPERLLGDALDARADVFSAGVLLWEALAGRRLFETDSVDSIVTRLMGAKVALPQLPPELSWAAPLRAVAQCALSVDPEQRFANCAELAEAIEAVAGDKLATHADVANYFGAPHLAARPSVIACPPRLPAHPSSLSALVAPAQPSAPAKSSSSESVSRLPPRSERRANGPIWAIAAIACLLSAFGGSAFARYRALQGAAHGATQSSPPPAESRPAAVPPHNAPPAPAPSASAAPDPVEPAAAPSASPSDRQKASKRPKAPKAPKALAPTVRVPSKAVRSADKTAAKYGI
jgi:serine/threonine-protein kinase